MYKLSPGGAVQALDKNISPFVKINNVGANELIINYPAHTRA